MMNRLPHFSVFAYIDCPVTFLGWVCHQSKRNRKNDVMPSHFFKTLKVSAPLDNEDLHPIIWKMANPDREHSPATAC
jgi:hypothetical protein